MNRTELLEKMKTWNVYLVMDLSGNGRLSAYEIAEQAVKGGVEVIQIREKVLDVNRFMELAGPIRELCRQNDVTFIVNDHVQMAVELDADGVHIGQEDMNGREARKLIGTRLMGISASSTGEAEKAIEAGADYLGVGSIYPTKSKADAGEAVSPSLIAEIRQFTDLPIVGIGGIAPGNAAAVIQAGAQAAAVISAICQAPSPREAADVLGREIKQAKEGLV